VDIRDISGLTFTRYVQSKHIGKTNNYHFFGSRKMIKELGIDNSLDNPTYTPTTLTKEEILDNHGSVLCSFEISTKDEELDLPSLYWIPKLHRCPLKPKRTTC
jgi:hypothetical protein